MSLILFLWMMLSTLPAQAEVTFVQGHDGSTARITDLGNGIGMTSDPHGLSGVSVAPPHPEQPRSGPHGLQEGLTITPFGSPTPPNHLTPPPILPFSPNRSLLPGSSQPAPPSAGSSPGRFGR